MRSQAIHDFVLDLAANTPATPDELLTELLVDEGDAGNRDGVFVAWRNVPVHVRVRASVEPWRVRSIDPVRPVAQARQIDHGRSEPILERRLDEPVEREELALFVLAEVTDLGDMTERHQEQRARHRLVGMEYQLPELAHCEGQRIVLGRGTADADRVESRRCSVIRRP